MLESDTVETACYEGRPQKLVARTHAYSITSFTQSMPRHGISPTHKREDGVVGGAPYQRDFTDA